MSNIFWNSSSLSSFFNTSLNASTSGLGGLYSAFSDSAMIKSGTYKKLMRSYFDTVESESKSSSSSSKTSSSKSSSSSSSSKSRHACTYTYDSTRNTVSKVSNKVLDELLSDEPRKSTITNPVLDELLKKDDKTTEDGTVTDKTQSDSSTPATEATAGSVIDESI